MGHRDEVDLDTPDEDRYIVHPLLENPIKVPGCKHEWCDFHTGTGMDRKNVNIQWQYMFCKHCLRTRLVKLDVSMMRLADEYEDEREEEGL